MWWGGVGAGVLSVSGLRLCVETTGSINVRGGRKDAPRVSSRSSPWQRPTYPGPGLAPFLHIQPHLHCLWRLTLSAFSKKETELFFVDKLLEITQARVGKIVQSNDLLIFLQPINIYQIYLFYVIFFHCFDFIFIIKSMFFQDLHDENEDD